MSLRDTQNSPENRSIPLYRVGIKKIRHPIAIQQRDGNLQHSIAVADLAVALPAEQRGTHMSRLVEVLQGFHEPLTPASFQGLLEKMLVRLEAEEGTISMAFPFFQSKKAPISKQKSLLDYDATLTADLTEAISLQFKLIIPVKSLCPASKEISLYGAHNQRSYITVMADWKESLFLEDVIELVESQASAPVFSLLKRADEKYITELAYENPKFVEDVVRDIVLSFREDPRFSAYIVEAENIESIHNHSAYAVMK